MKRYYKLSQRIITSFLVISLFLQSCSKRTNTPIDIKKEQTDKQPDLRIAKSSEKNVLQLPAEIWEYILLYVGYSDINTCRQVNRCFYGLIMRETSVSLVGIDNKLTLVNSENNWAIKKEIDFSSWRWKLRRIKPETFPRFFFYQLMRNVRHLPKELWPYLQGSNVHTVSFYTNPLFEVFDHSLRSTGVIDFAKNLHGTKVHTVNLKRNILRAQGFADFFKNLNGTSVKAVDLSYNQIEDAAAITLAKHLQGTNVEIINLSGNSIRKATRQLLEEQYPHIKWIF
ncbi:MAG: F-box protein [Candidatus Amoebophilus sp.]